MPLVKGDPGFVPDAVVFAPQPGVRRYARFHLPLGRCGERGCRLNHNLILDIPIPVLQEMADQAETALPNETAGSLMGSFPSRRTTYDHFRVEFQHPHQIRWATPDRLECRAFPPGRGKCRRAELKAIERGRSRSNTPHIGDWHSHPSLHSTELSDEDMGTMLRAQQRWGHWPLEVIMTMDDGGGWYAVPYKLIRGKFYWMEPVGMVDESGTLIPR